MLTALLHSLPIALGMVLMTVPVVAVPLVLVTRERQGPHHAFFAGWAAGFAILGTLAIGLSDLSTAGEAAPARWVVWLRLLLGLAIIGFAVPKLVAGWNGAVPPWIAALDRIGPGRAFGFGVALVVINPKNAVLVISGALAVAAAVYAPLAQAAAFAVFILVASLGLLAPLLLTRLLGPRAAGPITAARDWTIRHATVLTAAVLGFLGAAVVWNALTDLGVL